MATLAQGLAAIVASATGGETEPQTQYVSFPGFFFPVGAEALSAGVEPPAFDFAHRVNMIPGPPPLFMMNARFVWKIYRRVLEGRELPATSDAQAGFAKRFAAASGQMGDGRLTATLNNYWPVGVVPSVLDDPSTWTKVALDEPTIVSTAEGLGDAQARFMERFNTLAQLGDQLVASITFERATLVILRDWFDASLLGERFWDLPGVTLSDGLDPPNGELPAVITKLILIKNLEIALPSQALPDVGPGVIYMDRDGVAEKPLGLSERLTTLASPTETATMVGQPLSATETAVETQVEAVQAEAAEQVGLDKSGAPTGAQRFHVPIRFNTTGAMEATKAELAKAEADHLAATTVTQDTLARIGAMEAELAALPSSSGSSGTFGINIANPFRLALGMDLQVIRAGLKLAEDAVTEAEGRLKRWQDAVKVLEQLASIPHDPAAHVAAIVCDRTPKSPDPDPSLFT